MKKIIVLLLMIVASVGHIQGRCYQTFDGDVDSEECIFSEVHQNEPTTSKICLSDNPRNVVKVNVGPTLMVSNFQLTEGLTLCDQNENNLMSQTKNGNNSTRKELSVTPFYKIIDNYNYGLINKNTAIGKKYHIGIKQILNVFPVIYISTSNYLK